MRTLAVLLLVAALLWMPTVGAQYKPDQIHITAAGTPLDSDLQPPEATQLVFHWSVERPYLANHQPQVRYTIGNGTQRTAPATLVGTARDFSPPSATEEHDALPIYAARVHVPRGAPVTYQVGEPSGGFSTARTTRMLPDLVFNSTLVATGTIGYLGYDRLGQRIPGVDAPQERAFQQALNQSPDVALLLGNLGMSSSSKPWNGFMRSAEMLQSIVPTIPVPGPSDTDTNFHHLRERYVLPYTLPGNSGSAMQETEHLYHGYSVGSAYLIGISTPELCAEAVAAVPDVPPCTEGAPNGAQLTWLHDILEDAREDLHANWIIAYMSDSPYVYADDGNNLVAQQLVSPLLDAYSVDLVLTGGELVYQRTHPIRSGVAVTREHARDIPAGLGPVYVTTANARGANVPPITDTYPPWLAVHSSIPHITRINVTMHTLTVTAIATADGRVLDEFTIHKRTSPAHPDAATSPTPEPAQQSPAPAALAVLLALLVLVLSRKPRTGGNA